ncbi:MAG: hypothetical protein GY832_24860 [Chloroflexi bacterium]|nr:hypothetical protein [Chloroflexota bacterium]
MSHDHRLVGAILILLFIALLACTPLTSPTPQMTEEPVQLLTPISPEGTVFFDDCTYMVSHPPELLTTDGILFQSDDESVFVFITARRRTDAEQDASLDALATQIGTRWVDSSNAPSFEPVQVTDYLGNALDGLQAELSGGGGERVRFMIVVRPETMLGDLLPNDVVYQIVAQAPEDVWSEWAASFEVMFQTFYPKDCGGV